MHPKRILVVCQHFWPENFRIHDLCLGFVERGYRVTVLCGIPNYPKGRFFPGYGFFRNRRQIHQGIRIHRVFEIPRFGNTNLSIFLNYLSFPFFSLFHLPWFLFRKYDHVFMYQLSPVMMSLFGIVLARVKRIKATMYVLDLWPDNLYSVLPFKNRVIRSMLEAVCAWHYRQVPNLVCLSESMRDRLIKMSGTREARSTVILQSCEKIYETEVHDVDLVERFQGRFRVVMAGNLSPAQAHGTIVDAAAELKKRGLKDILFIIVGDGMSRKDFEAEVRDRDLQEMFAFEGMKPMERIPAYTTMADVLLGTLSKSPMLGYTVPAKVMSYLAAGKPIVLSMDDEPKKLMDEIACGFCTPAEDAPALADALERIRKLTDEERQALGKAAKDFHVRNLQREIGLSRMIAFMES